MLGRTEDNKGQGRFENVAFYCSDVDETEVSHRQHTTRPHELTNEIDRMGTLHTPIA
jgi:hypothetical protein